MTSSFKFLLFLLAFIACNALLPETISLQSSSTPGTFTTYNLPAPYARILVPYGGETNVTLNNGHWKVGNRIVQRFGYCIPYNPIYDGSNVNAWLPNECRFTVVAHGMAPPIDGCYLNYSDPTVARTDSPTALTQGSEVKFACNVTLIIIAEHHITVTVYYSIQSYSMQQLGLLEDGAALLKMAWQNPPAWVPPPIILFLKFCQCFQAFNQTISMAMVNCISLLGTDFSTTALYNLAGGTAIFMNSGSNGPQSEIQTYMDEGSNLKTDTLFFDSGFTAVHAMITTRTVRGQPTFLVTAPQLPSSNPFSTLPTQQDFTFAFNRDGLYQAFYQDVNIYPFVLQGSQSGLMPNITNLCGLQRVVCPNTLVQANYPPSPFPCPFPVPGNPSQCSTQQFPDFMSCFNYYMTLAAGPPVAVASTGPYLSCVQYHMNIAQLGTDDAAVHCLHTGPQYILPGYSVITPCTNITYPA